MMPLPPLAMVSPIRFPLVSAVCASANPVPALSPIKRDGAIRKNPATIGDVALRTVSADDTLVDGEAAGRERVNGTASVRGPVSSRPSAGERQPGQRKVVGVGRDIEDARLQVGIDRHILRERRSVDRECLGDRQLRTTEGDCLAGERRIKKK